MYLIVNKNDKRYSETIEKIRVMLALIRSQQRLDIIYDYVDWQYSLEKRRLHNEHINFIRCGNCNAVTA